MDTPMTPVLQPASTTLSGGHVTFTNIYHVRPLVHHQLFSLTSATLSLPPLHSDTTPPYLLFWGINKLYILLTYSAPSLRCGRWCRPTQFPPANTEQNTKTYFLFVMFTSRYSKSKVSRKSA